MYIYIMIRANDRVLSTHSVCSHVCVNIYMRAYIHECRRMSVFVSVNTYLSMYSHHVIFCRANDRVLSTHCV